LYNNLQMIYHIAFSHICVLSEYVLLCLRTELFVYGDYDENTKYECGTIWVRCHYYSRT